MNFLINNARLVLTDRIVEHASLLIEDGLIASIEPIDPILAQDAHVMDLGNRYLLPGMIDLHADALEKDIEPRPKEPLINSPQVI
ncbi:MAG: hypothetical protein IPG31_10140 [Nitrosomonas sp.]|nr:hypothetical protein [Nitrosomonas sp.]